MAVFLATYSALRIFRVFKHMVHFPFPEPDENRSKNWAYADRRVWTTIACGTLTALGCVASFTASSLLFYGVTLTGSLFTLGAAVASIIAVVRKDVDPQILRIPTVMATTAGLLGCMALHSIDQQPNLPLEPAVQKAPKPTHPAQSVKPQIGKAVSAQVLRHAAGNER